LSDPTNSGLTRRELMKKTGQLAVASALAGATIPYVHAAGSDTIQIALVGCGGRGTGAAEDAIASKYGPVKLVAMADVFEDRLKFSHKTLKDRKLDEQMDVPEDRRFIGFDGYQKAMDCLKPGDVVILATPPAFRWVHFTYAIQKGLNVFMEKPVAVDGASARRMFKLADDSETKGLKVGVGLMCRHCVVRGELYQRLKDGAIGDITLLRAYRVKGPEATQYTHKRPLDTPEMSDISELGYQIRRFHSLLWASGGSYSDFLIHNIDECCWMKDTWPVEARGIGGRHYRSDRKGDFIDQNFDHYTVEYTFGDGTKLMLESRNIVGCWSAFASYAHGTKGSAIISAESHTPAYSRIYKGQQIPFGKPRGNTEVVWKGPDEEPNPYRLEWDDLLRAIRQGSPYNEVRRGAEASLITAMGRKASHTGQVIKRDDPALFEHEMAPDVDKLVAMDSPAPVRADKDGKYPVPEPGQKGKMEY
jgi:predicted dehydrogenase